MKETNGCLKSENKKLEKALNKAQNAARKDMNANKFVEPLPIFTCHICEQTSQTKSAMRLHLDEKHSELERHLDCKVCSGKSIPPKSFKCVVCWELLETYGDLKNHMGSKHEVSINAEKLDEPSEEEYTTRVLESMDIDEEVFEDLYIRDVEHRVGILKVRILTRKSFEASSKVIENKMEKNKVLKKIIDSYGFSAESYF